MQGKAKTAVDLAVENQNKANVETAEVEVGTNNIHAHRTIVRAYKPRRCCMVRVRIRVRVRVRVRVRESKWQRCCMEYGVGLTGV